MKRNHAIDILRVFCCYCIIMLHVSGHLDLNGNFWRLVQGGVRPTLWCFVTISGYFILSRPIIKWSEFYFKHLSHLLIPLIFYSFVYQLYFSGGKNISLLAIIAGNSAGAGHLWFVYTLIVLYILAPFLQKMVVHLNNVQLMGLLIVIFFCGRVIKIMAALGFEIGIPTSLIGERSLFFFILGYLLSRIKLNMGYKALVSLGIVNILYCAYTLSNPILVDGAADLSLSMVTGVLIYYLLFSKAFANIKNIFLIKIVTFLSVRTYGIYLIHMLIFQYFTANEIMVLDPYSNTRIWVLPLKCLVIFLIGLIFATLIDLLVCNPIQKVLEGIVRQLKEKEFQNL